MQGESEKDMALIKADGTVLYQGAVLDTSEHYWADGMLSEYARIWDMEKHQYEAVSVGYYGADGHNFIGTKVEIEVSTDVARNIIRTLKQRAYKDFFRSVIIITPTWMNPVLPAACGFSAGTSSSTLLIAFLTPSALILPSWPSAWEKSAIFST